ncbi:MAG TPA: FAD-dependent oxidoreductase, partial [Homoserinimonas sp.]|nr:FAD-dependent oxidoreductase [Homoserinimonas sp.]
MAGGSLGGLRAAEQLRARGYAGPIRVIGDEIHPPYNRPPLSKEILASPTTAAEALSGLVFRQRTSTADVQWTLGVTIVGSDLAARRVRLNTGEEVAFDGLVIATGLRPRRLDIDAPAAGRFVVRTIEHSITLRERLRPGARVVVVGAGFIGCEVAAAAMALGCEVTVIEGSTGPMESSIGPALSSSLKAFLETRGVRFRAGRRVIGLLSEADGACAGVTLDDGTEVAADAVVESIGSVPNVDWLQGNSLDLTDGVLCDDRMRVVGTSGVVAVGDIARFPDSVLGGPARRVEHWATPGDTAKIAAGTLVADLAGGPPPETAAPLPSFWTDLFGIRVFGVGTPGLATSVQELEGDLAAPELGLALGYLR